MIGTTFNLVVFSVLLFRSPSSACNGFKSKINYIDNCGSDDQIITIDSNTTSTMTKNCEIMTIGCVTTKPFETALVKYKITKNGMVMKQEEINLCQKLENVPDEAKGILSMFKLPSSCPMKSDHVCSDESKVMNISKFKKFLALAKGKTEIDIKIEHDTGTSCFKLGLEIYK